MSKKRYTDETTQIKIIKKGKKHLIAEDESEDYSDLEKTREFNNAFLKGGDRIVRYHPEISEGLSDEEIASRKKDGLTNKCRDKNKKTVIGIICKNLFTFLNILLYLIGAVLLAVGAKPMNCTFLVIISCNLLIGIYQEIRAKIKIDKLAVLANVRTIVIRNGIQYEVDADDLVLDDIVQFLNGKKVTADSVIQEGQVEVNESLLTGETLPVKKGKGDILFAGSFISGGSCYAKVERVGKNSYISQLQSKVKKYKKNNSQILKTLNSIIRWVSYAVIPLGIAMFLMAWGRDYGFATDAETIKLVILNAAGSMVAMIPSGLYLTTSVTLFVAQINLSTYKALVQDTYSVESLARVDVLCLDKTGTITDGTMRVEGEIVYDDSLDSHALVYNLMNGFEERNQTALAILDHYKCEEKYTVVRKLPFSSSRKMSAMEFDGIGSFVVGAPEFVLKPDDKIVKELEKYTLQGYRVILLARVDGFDDEIKGTPRPIASYIIKDHIREEAYDTIRWFKENGVDIKIISGDNPQTVSVIAREVGVENADRCISLEGLSLEEVGEAATKYSVFGRVAPEQKATLVQALKAAGHTVAMTGDGVNDILAMKRSDCSIAMAGGSEASRNVAQLVLMDSNFASMPKIVEEGRRVINNVQAVASLFLMKTIFAIVLSASTFYPYEPINLQVLEVAVIGIPSFLLALQPNKELVKGNFFRNVIAKCLPSAVALILVTVFALVFCNLELFSCRSEMVQTVGGISLSFIGLVILAYYCYPFNAYRLSVYFLMLIIGTLLIFVPPLIGWDFTGFRVYELNVPEILLIVLSLVVAVIVFFAGEYLSGKIVAKNEKTNSKN